MPKKKRKRGRPFLSAEERRSVLVRFRATPAQAIGLGWVAKARGVTVAELVHGWVVSYLVPELQVLELQLALAEGNKRSDDGE